MTATASSRALESITEISREITKGLYLTAASHTRSGQTAADSLRQSQAVVETLLWRKFSRQRLDEGFKSSKSVPPAVAGGYCAAKTHPLPQVVLTSNHTRFLYLKRSVICVERCHHS